MKLHVDWLPDDRYVDGGSWAIFTANGHLFATMARKGNNKTTLKRAQQMVAAFNRDQDN